MRTWRNWQTRKIQVLVSIWFMQVQVLLSAPNETQLNHKWFDWDFLFVYFSVKGYFLLKKMYESIKAVDFCGKLI